MTEQEFRDLSELDQNILYAEHVEGRKLVTHRKVLMCTNCAIADEPYAVMRYTYVLGLEGCIRALRVVGAIS